MFKKRKVSKFKKLFTKFNTKPYKFKAKNVNLINNYFERYKLILKYFEICEIFNFPFQQNHFFKNLNGQFIINN